MPLAFLCLCLYVPELFRKKNLGILVAVPLFLFLAVHLISAYLSSTSFAIKMLVQTATVLAFVWPFTIRYSQRPIGPFFAAFCCLVGALMAYVIYWHVSRGLYISWKRLLNEKTVFVVLPLILLGLRNWRPIRHLMAPIVILSVIIILLSGERKAYVLLAVAFVLMLNWRNPLTYLVPLIVILVLPFAGEIDKSGYVDRQLATMSGFAEGKVVKSISNHERQEQIRIASSLIRENPAFGIGTGEYNNSYLPQNYANSPLVLSIHGEFTRIMVENGALGLFLYLLNILVSIVGVLFPIANKRPRPRGERVLAAFLLFTLITYVSVEAFDVIIMTATCLMPYVQWLRLSPSALPRARAAAVSPGLARARLPASPSS